LITACETRLQPDVAGQEVASTKFVSNLDQTVIWLDGIIATWRHGVDCC
jgi:hypothetical protein